jgi:hypothetical protein
VPLGAESPYLELLRTPARTLSGQIDKESTEHIQLGPLALRIKEQIKKLNCDAIEQSDPLVTGVDLWGLLHMNVVGSLRPLVDQLYKANLPCPESEFFLGDYDEELFADISWPNASPPIAILAGGQSAYRDVWVERGWRVFDSTVTVAQLRENLRC